MPEWRNWYTHSTQNAATRVMSVRVRPRAPFENYESNLLKVYTL